ncbi:hypothetical protein [Plantactinospora sonchi]|uniref:EVE domain-containing protein n=1 Tax=Plantactinospora sonchi TaxID=1544735 RepID=A0ABU7RXW4_9ACTN
MSSAYLVVLGERDAIRWVLAEQRMAFPATQRTEVTALTPDDRLLLYATRGAWHNPTRDRGRLIGTATVTGPVRRLDPPVEIAERAFHSGCRLAIDGVVPYPGGLELQPLVTRLAAFPKPHAWSIYLRRPLLRLTDDDYTLLERELHPLLTTRGLGLSTYPSTKVAAGN